MNSDIFQTGSIVMTTKLNTLLNLVTSQGFSQLIPFEQTCVNHNHYDKGFGIPYPPGAGSPASKGFTTSNTKTTLLSVVSAVENLCKSHNLANIRTNLAVTNFNSAHQNWINAKKSGNATAIAQGSVYIARAIAYYRMTYGLGYALMFVYEPLINAIEKLTKAPIL